MNVFRRLVLAGLILFSLGTAIMAANGYVEKILFSTLDKYNRSQIYAVNPDGSGLSQITDQPGLGASYPCVSPDGTKIVFVTALHYGNSAIMMMNSDGSSLTNIYPGNGYSGSLLLRPRFNKNGRLLYFIKSVNSNMETMELDLATKVSVVKGNIKSSSLQTDSSGNIIFESSNRSCFSDIFRCKLDGSDSKLLVKNANSPDISPDGKYITFHRTKKYTDIFTLDEKGVEKQLTDNKYCNYDPAFNPEGTKIAFCSYGVDVNPGTDFKISIILKEGIGVHDIISGFNSRLNNTTWVKLSANPQPKTPDVPWDDEWKLLINPPKPDIYASENKSLAEYGLNQFTDNQIITNYVKSRQISTYYVKVKNCGDVAVPFIVKASINNINGWTLKTMDSNNVDTTRAILSSTGVITPVILPGKVYNFRLETSPSSTLMNDSVIDIVLTVYSSIDTVIKDEITVRTTKVRR